MCVKEAEGAEGWRGVCVGEYEGGKEGERMSQLPRKTMFSQKNVALISLT